MICISSKYIECSSAPKIILYAQKASTHARSEEIPKPKASIIYLPLHTSSLSVVDIVIVRIIISRDETLLAQKSKPSSGALVTHLQREAASSSIPGHHDLGDLSRLLNNLHSVLHRGQQSIHPFLHGDILGSRELYGDVENNGQLLIASRQEGLAQVTGATFALLSAFVNLDVGSIQKVLEEFKVTLGFVNGDVEEAYTAHGGYSTA